MNFTARLRRTILGMLLAPLGVLAQPEPGDRQALHDCAMLETAAERLECIDAELAPRDAEKAGAAEAASSSSESTETGTRPRGARPGEDRDDDDGERTIVVVDVRTRVPGRVTFVTEDGERFVQTSGSSRLFMPEVPFEAVLREGMIGSLFLAPVDEGYRAVRVSTSD